VLNHNSMSTRKEVRHLSSRPTAGFTAVELALTLAVVGLLTAMSMPRVGRTLQHMRVNRATATVAADLEQAFSTSARMRKPIRVTFNTAALSYTLADRSGGTVRLTRSLTAPDYQLQSLAATATPLDVFPSGVATATDTVTIGSGGYTRRIVVTSAGLVRILP
jgi:type II secretory pathway pseudopilin PulG